MELEEMLHVDIKLDHQFKRRGLKEFPTAEHQIQVAGKTILPLRTSQSRKLEKKAPISQKGSPKPNLSKHQRIRANLILNLQDLEKLFVLSARDNDTSLANSQKLESWY